MTSAWLHILIVHFPVLGSILLLFLGFNALKTKKMASYKYLYWGSIFIALTAGIAYFSGPGTAVWVKENTTRYNKEIIENHALWGRIGFSIGILMGLLGVMAIANYAQDEEPHPSIPWIVFGIIFILLLVFAYTAHLGGFIRRPDLL
jgi:uncharacterized membrane protein YedE/YeeE